MIDKSMFLVRSRNPNDELRVLNFLELARSLQIQVIQHYWNREPQASNQIPTQSFNVKVNHVLAYEAGYNKAFGSLIGQLNWQMFILFHILRERPSIVYACDLDSAIIPTIYKRLFPSRKFTLFFDEFDRFSTRSDNFGTLPKKLFSFFEHIVYKSADYVVVASNERKLEETNIVIQNIPTCERDSKSNGKHETPKVSYVGLIQDDRGLKALIQALKIKNNWSCLISGFGSNFEEIHKLASSNVQVQGGLSQSDTMGEFSQAWLTIATYDPKFENNRFSASSKVLQSLLANTPVIVSKGGILEDIVAKFGLGWVVEYNNSLEIAAALTERELWSERDLNLFMKNTKIYIDELQDQQNWNLAKLSNALKSKVILL